MTDNVLEFYFSNPEIKMNLDLFINESVDVDLCRGFGRAQTILF